MQPQRHHPRAPPQTPPAGDPEAALRAARLLQEMTLAPVGSKQRRFLRRAAERARRQAQAEQRRH
jgi:hypothetical protein